MGLRRSLALLVACALALVACAPRSGGVSDAGERVEVVDGWQYRWGDSPRAADGTLEWLRDPDTSAEWRPMAFPAKPPGRGDRVWMRVRLPEGEWKNPTLLIDPVMIAYEAYLDGERIHRVGDVDAERFRWTGVPWSLIALPPDAGGRTLSLRIRSSYFVIGVHGRIFVGSRAAHTEAIARVDVGRVAVALVSALLGLVALGFGLFGVERPLTTVFGVYSIGTGAYALYYTKLKDLIVDNTFLWDDVHRFASLASMVSIVMFVERVFGRGRYSIVRRLWQLHLAVGVAYLGFIHTVGYRSSYNWQLIAFQTAWGSSLRAIIAVELVAIMVVIIMAAKRRSKDGLIFLVGIAPSTFLTGRDLLAFFGVIHFEWDSLTYLGTLWFTLSLVVVVGRRYLERLRGYVVELDRKSREKAMMMKDLHDGIGGITTNISLLADVATRTDSPDRVERAVEDISELSREGIAEIRSFVDSLDEADISWQRLVNELRHLGRRTLEAHDLSFDLESDVAEDVAPPASFVYLNVVRIFRECMTNIVKHANAKSVRTRIQIRAEGLKLIVQDDGVGAAESRREGHGLVNMDSRARDLGGTLQVRFEGGTSVALEVPLPTGHPDMGVAGPPVPA